REIGRTDALGTWRGALDDGEHRLDVMRDGYESQHATLRIPHDGRWADARVRLRSLRARALEPFRSLALRVLPGARSWNVLTNREIATQHAARLSSIEPLVEQAYYAAPVPDPSLIEAIERDAARLAAEDDASRSRQDGR
ncbi:MAG: hypothetical protein NZ898_16940, partial [Myxococcota bacterium]|nr:hypothetical protein [Myxococcota bacterium]